MKKTSCAVAVMSISNFIEVFSSPSTFTQKRKKRRRKKVRRNTYENDCEEKKKKKKKKKVLPFSFSDIGRKTQQKYFDLRQTSGRMQQLSHVQIRMDVSLSFYVILIQQASLPQVKALMTWPTDRFHRSSRFTQCKHVTIAMDRTLSRSGSFADGDELGIRETPSHRP